MNKTNRRIHNWYIGVSSIVIIPTLALILRGQVPGTLFAQGYEDISLTPIVTATPHDAPGTATITFAQIGQEDLILQSPSDMKTVEFELPYRWQVLERESTTYVEFHIDITSAGSAQTASGTPTPEMGAVFDVYFDDYAVASMTPRVAPDQVVRFTIPAQAINDDPDDSYHSLRLVFFAGPKCETMAEMRLIVRNTSFMHFGYREIPLEVDLADFPRPLIQNPFADESALIVIPEQYSEADLSAAASVAAAIGRSTFGSLSIDLKTADQVDLTKIGQQSVVIVGQPGQNALLKKLYRAGILPTTLASVDNTIVGPTGFAIAPTDGVLQEIVSDFSQDSVYLVVTGNTDEAVLKAARALSAPPPRFGFSGQLVVIGATNQTPPLSENVPEAFTLESLNFDDTTFYGVGTQHVTANFYVPADWSIEPGASVDLAYMHSASLDPVLSGLTVELNGEPIGSLPLNQEGVGERRVLMSLPVSEIVPGERNRLTFEATTELPEKCVSPTTRVAWVRILKSSTIYLPHAIAPDRAGLNLESNIISIFSSRFDLSDLWISIPEQPSAEELAGMAQVAWLLGGTSSGYGFSPQVSVGAIADQDALDKFNVIVVGLPSANPLIAELNPQLPQPFTLENDSLEPSVGNVTYRLPDNYSLGVIQLLPAPWNPNQAIAAISGTNQQGIGWALTAFTDGELLYSITGNLTFVREHNIESIETGQTTASGVLQAIETTVAPTPLSLMAMTQTAQPSLSTALPEQYAQPQDIGLSTPLIITISVLLGLGVVIAGGGIYVSWKRSR